MSGLVVVAVVIVAAQFVDLPARKPIPAAARSAIVQVAVTERTFDVPLTPAIVGELSGRADLLRTAAGRDPFAWPRQAPVLTNAPGTKAPFVVSAISIDAGKALAVINQRIVAVGDTLGGYVVEQILPDEVRLRGPEGPVTARMAQ